jgi:hypothetical protein
MNEKLYILLFVTAAELGLITTSLKWGTKRGLAGGSVYLASHQGLFGTAEHVIVNFLWGHVFSVQPLALFLHQSL